MPERKYNVVVVRHPRENTKKCSLSHLHGNPNFKSYTAFDGFSLDATGYLMLEMNAPEVNLSDFGLPILLLDSTWALLPRLRAKISGDPQLRSLPASIKTAYPRKSKLFEDLDGLDSIEVLYSALKIMNIPDPEILRGYIFAKKFLEINNWGAEVLEFFSTGIFKSFNVIMVDCTRTHILNARRKQLYRFISFRN